MNKSYILPLAAVALLASACSKENAFDNSAAGEGQFLKSALAMDINAQELEKTRASVYADINNFKVNFFKDGHSEPYATYVYGEMPEVITLPAATYSITATYGEDRIAEWENPYFLGNSEAFEVNAKEVCSFLEPIECRLENIKVTVDFDEALRSAMSEDSYVEIKVGTSSPLNYGLAEADAKKAGYFKHSNEISLVAVFHGTINGQETVETKSLKDIQKGNHYKIMFRLHNDMGPDGSGNLNGDVTVDANVTAVDVTRDVEIGDDPLLDDSERPTEGNEDDNPDDPENPDDPGTPDNPAPTITPGEGLTLDGSNNGNTLEACILYIHSDAPNGITEMYCDIDSPKLTDEELHGAGLASHLDLANTPSDMAAALKNFGFPVNVKGWKDVTFNITDFLETLGDFGSFTHKFVITVKDEYGETTKTLTLDFSNN